MIFNIFFLGNAGCGKTRLAYAFNRWLKGRGFKSIVCNLDPAAEYFPYTPDFDIKGYVDARKLMVEEGLGPNGAILSSVDRMLKMFRVWFNDILNYDVDFRIFDTPGQLEILLYRNSAISIISKIGEKGRNVGVFLVEAKLVRDPVSLTVLLMQANITKVRLDMPTVLVISKSDLKLRNDLEMLLSNSEYLENRVVVEGVGGQKSAAILLCKALAQMPWRQRIIKVSSSKRSGFKNLYEIINEAMCVCGDLT
ncbi:MAG: ATP/GTP-binding protein [Nitrososphaeria archaeon]|nr:ATP/GTP-binding protein [Nitrososphaeria archaeon]